jgi:hypothetical protein
MAKIPKKMNNTTDREISFRILQTKAFSQVITILKDFTECVNIVLNNEGLQIVATDSKLYILLLY